MSGEKYIYKKRESFQVRKTINYKAHTYGNYSSLDEAVFARDLFIKYNWDLNKIKGNILKFKDRFIVFAVFNNQLNFIKTFSSQKEAEENADELIEEFRKNLSCAAENRYIHKRLSYFDVSKSVSGKEKRFGIYKNMDDAKFSRDLLESIAWNLDKISQVYYSRYHDCYLVVSVFNDKLVIVDKFDSEAEAKNNAEKAIENYSPREYASGEKNIVMNGKYFAIHKYNGQKIIYYGSFADKNDAVAVRDVLIDNEWDISLIDENKIYEVNGYFWKLHIFEGIVKILGKYESVEDAEYNLNNYSDLTYDDLYNPDNQYSSRNRHISKRLGKYWIRKKINGNPLTFGPYDTRDEAIDARDEFEQNNWQFDVDEDSIFGDGGKNDDFADIVSSLSMWQKIIYDTIDRLNKSEFTFDELISHSFIKRYKSGKNFEDKVQKHLDELIGLGLVSYNNDIYRREF